MPGEEQIIDVLCGGTVLLLFLSLMLILRFAAGVSWRLETDPGRPLRKSWLGSGGINSVSCRGMMQVVEYPKGWLVRMLPTWFFGVLWFPKDQTVVGELEPATWYSPQWRTLKTDSDSVILTGHLADFVTPLGEGKMDAEPKNL
jgi:hypothetical protein